MNQRILLVDDEPLLLAAMRELLEDEFELTTALGPEAGLARLDQKDPFAVVVSDYHMPVMNGIAFLSRVRLLMPDAIRAILTGGGDLDIAMQAVNEGQIFRFLTKPCPRDTLSRTLKACLEQHRLIRAEHELLANTLAGSIYVLSEMLALANPGAFGQAARIRRSMRHMAQCLGLEDLWLYEVAGLLSQIGCVSIAPEILHKNWAGQKLTREEGEMIAAHPALGRDLLGHIPRLETIAQMIARQCTPPPAHSSPPETDPPAAVLGGTMLLVALALDQRISQGLSMEKALADLSRQPQLYPPRLVWALATLEPAGHNMTPRTVTIRQLETFMVLDEDVCARNGMLIACRGSEVTIPMMRRLRSFALGVGVREPFRVLMPSDGELRLTA